MSFKFLKNKIFWLLVISVIIIISVFYINILQGRVKHQMTSSIFETVNSGYADTTLKYMSLEEKAGQMIIVDFGKSGVSNNDSLIKFLYQVMPGGLIYKTDSLSQFINSQNIIQKYSKINLFTFLPEDLSLFNFKDIETFPLLHFLSAVTSDSVKRNYIKVMSDIAVKANINTVNFNPYFNKKKYKISKDEVQIYKFKKILSFENIERFINSDSTQVLNNSKIISCGLTCLFCDENIPSSEIKKVTEKYEFENLIIKQINSKNVNSDTLVTFIISGVDLFITENPNLLKVKLSEAFENELVSEEKIDETVRKILLAKTWTGLEKNKRLIFENVKKSLQLSKTKAAKLSVYKNSVSLLKNKDEILPFKNLKKKFQIIVLGKTNIPEFYKRFISYSSVKKTYINSGDINFVKKLKAYKKQNNQIIVINDYRIDSIVFKAIIDNNKAKSLVLINLKNTENLQFADTFSAIIQTIGNSKYEQEFAADALFGGINVTGKCPYKIKKFAGCDSVKKIKKIRVSKCLPEEAGLNSEVLSKIDSIASDGIRRGAFPGCQIVVLKNGFNVYDKTFGYHTYAKRQRVGKNDLYDLASITKIASTTTAAMKLYDQGRIRLNDKLGRFFRDTKIDYSNIKPDTIVNIDTLKYTEIKDFKKILKYQDTLRINDSTLIAYDTLIVTATPKNNIFQVRIRDLLLHKSGITPTLPILPYVLYKKNFYDSLEIIKKRFYGNINKDTTAAIENIEFNARTELNKIYDNYFSHRYIKDSVETKIADGFYFKNTYFDTLWRDTKRLRVYSRKIYQYSDINMILLQSAIDSLNRRSMNSYMRNTFYLPMGLNTMCYKPRRYFSLNRIVPTENDKYWREQLLRGNVHDPSAAMLGGISGNAGLFSDAYDLAVLGQMWLNGGTYGGIRYLSEATVKKFTGYQEDSHRGLGFDKPHKKAIIGKGASLQSYGHTGFTGTCIWVDPENEIVFVFLSNRVNPSAKNWRINRLKIRQKIHTVVYDAMKTNNFN